MVRGDRVAAVGPGDRLDDGQPETGSVTAAALLGAGEPLERKAQEVGRESAALIVNVKLDRAVCNHRAERHCALPVTQSVLE
jgi:hypothetical protein